MSAREQILDAADALFGELGFDAASTRQIAESSGVNKALIHYHFSTKEALFGAVLDRYYERLTAVLGEALVREGSLEERFGSLLEAYLEFLDENRAFSAMVQREIAGGRHLDRIVGHMVPLFQSAVELIRREYPATRAGELAAAELLVSFYGMMVTYVAYRPVIDRLVGSGAEHEAAGLRRRKRHLRRMLSLVIAELERTSSS